MFDFHLILSRFKFKLSMYWFTDLSLKITQNKIHIPKLFVALIGLSVYRFIGNVIDRSCAVFASLHCQKVMCFLPSFHYDFQHENWDAIKSNIRLLCAILLVCMRCKEFLVIDEAPKWNGPHEKWRCNEHNK